MKKYDNYNIYICRILQKNKDVNISKDAKNMLNDIIKEITKKYIDSCILLTSHSKRSTIDDNSVILTTELFILNKEICNDIIKYTNDVWEKYSINILKETNKNNKAGLILPPSRFKKILKKKSLEGQMIGESSYIYLTAVIEYILSLILKKVCKELKTKTITDIDVYSSIKEFVFLHLLLKDMYFVGLDNI